MLYSIKSLDSQNKGLFCQIGSEDILIATFKNENEFMFEPLLDSFWGKWVRDHI